MTWIEADNIEIIFGCFQKYELLSPVIVQITRRHIIQIAALNRRVVTVERFKFPYFTRQRQSGDGILTQKCNVGCVRVAERNWLQAVET